MAIRIPVRVRGRDADGTTWDEITACLDASVGGAAIAMSHPVRPGQVLHLSMPLPLHFRQFDVGEPSYRVYGLVRSALPLEARSRVGLFFLGPTLARGTPALPAELFGLRESRVAPAAPSPPRLHLRLEAGEAPGGVLQQEQPVFENLTATSAVARVALLSLSRGTVLTLAESEGAFSTRAEVKGITIDELGRARVILQIIGPPLPARLIGDGTLTGN